MLYIDGAQGEGGGQILRSALSLAMATGTAIKLENIRAGRSKPGLMRQHLACVKAAQAISDAEVSGAKVGSTAVVFKPQAINAGNYEFSVGSAGSTVLIFQTVLPALMLANKSSCVVFHGGTHNAWAPSVDFINLAFVPVLRQIGITVELKLQKHGFYPQGGGQWQAVVHPLRHPQALDLREVGKLKAKQAVATYANIPGHVAERELAMLNKKSDWLDSEMRIHQVDALGGGNMLSLRYHYGRYSEVIEHVGKIGVSAENVARAAIKEARRYFASAAVVGEHLADQLLLPLSLSKGGLFRSLKPSLHCKTNSDIIQQFNKSEIFFKELNKDLYEVRVSAKV